MVFIDGRFRVACCLNAVRYCKKLTIIIIHDFFSEQGCEHYQNVLLKYLDVVDKADSLGVFYIKKEIDYKVFYVDYEAYKYKYNYN